MNYVKTILMAMALVLAWAPAPSLAQNSKIEVFRGGSAETVKTAKSSGIVVLRGKAAGKPRYRGHHAARHRHRHHKAAVRFIAAGSSLWLVDLRKNKATQCGTRGTGYVGGRRIVCRSRALY